MAEERRCNKCGQTKPLTEFARFKRLSWCKECKRQYEREYYRANKARRIEWNERNVQIRREFILKYLLAHPCADCGEADPIVLDFDHVQGEKIEAVSAMAWQGYSIERLEAEIAKCEVVCSNCHRRRTHARRTVKE